MLQKLSYIAGLIFMTQVAIAQTSEATDKTVEAAFSTYYQQKFSNWLPETNLQYKNWFTGDLNGNNQEEYIVEFGTHEDHWVTVFQKNESNATILTESYNGQRNGFHHAFLRIDKITDKTITGTVHSNNDEATLPENREYKIKLEQGKLVGEKTQQTLQKVKENATLNIVDYFLLYQFSDTNSNLLLYDYELVSSKDRKVIIDTDNAYLFIEDKHGNNVGFASITMTYFRDNKGEKNIAISTYDESGGMWSRYPFHLYKFENNMWKNNTKQVIPEITMLNFMDEDFVKKQTEDQLEDFRESVGSILKYELPQKGTTIKVSPANINHPSFSGKELMKYKEIHLLWNKSKGSFEIGKKIRM